MTNTETSPMSQAPATTPAAAASTLSRPESRCSKKRTRQLPASRRKRAPAQTNGSALPNRQICKRTTPSDTSPPRSAYPTNAMFTTSSRLLFTPASGTRMKRFIDSMRLTMKANWSISMTRAAQSVGGAARSPRCFGILPNTIMKARPHRTITMSCKTLIPANTLRRSCKTGRFSPTTPSV